MTAPDLTALPPMVLAMALATAPDEDTASRVRAEIDRRAAQQQGREGEPPHRMAPRLATLTLNPL